MQNQMEGQPWTPHTPKGVKGAHRAGEGGKEGALPEVHTQCTRVLRSPLCAGDTEPEFPESDTAAQQGADRKHRDKVERRLSRTRWIDYGPSAILPCPENRLPRATDHLADLSVSPGKAQGPLRQASRNTHLWDWLSTSSPYSEGPINRPRTTVLPICILVHHSQIWKPQITRYSRTSPKSRHKSNSTYNMTLFL